MFRIKICGITNVRDALLAGHCGADAVGLNFYPKSRRYVTAEQAERIIERLPHGVARVGLFVNATDDEICRLYDHLQLDMIQLHGDEPADFLPSLGQRPVLRAFRLGPGGVGPIVDYVAECGDLAALPAAILIDAYDPDHYGGTGKSADWELLAAERHRLGPLPLVLAGGLRADNVAEAIGIVAPDAVDTASGVESAPGEKDEALMRGFAGAAAEAFALL